MMNGSHSSFSVVVEGFAKIIENKDCSRGLTKGGLVKNIDISTT